MFALGHALDMQSFLFLLDLEIKRARRYQNYLSLLSLNWSHLNPSLGGNPSISLETLANLLKDELRESDVIGKGGANRILVMLPHADMAEAHKVRERVEQILQDYGLSKKGLIIEIGEVCFPTHATNIDELLRIAGNTVPEHRP